MPKRKIKKKELVRPDEFEAAGYGAIRLAGEAWRTAAANPRKYGAIGGAIGLGLVVAVALWVVQGRRAAEAQEGFSSILLGFQSLQSRSAGQNQTTKAASQSESGDSWVSDSLVLQEKLKEFVSRGAGPARLNREALFLLGNVSLRRGEVKEAMTWLEKFEREAPASDGLRPLAWNSLGYACEAQADSQRASDYFRKASESGGVAAAEATLGLARNLIALGKKDEARQAYEGYLKKYPETRGAPIARAGLTRLGAGAAPAEAAPATAVPGGS